MRYENWQKTPERFLAMTGYTHEQFPELLPMFEDAHNEYFTHNDINGKRRKNTCAFVIYKNSPLPTIQERLVFILSYLKLNPIQQQHAVLFDMEQKQCNQFVHTLKLVLDKSLENLEVMPSETSREFLDALAKEPQTAPQIFIHDGTEREIPRPQDPDEQAENYSGKKKKHTVKNAVIINMFCVILFVGATVSGKTHDKKIADTQYGFPSGAELWQDTGYQGYNPAGVKIVQPVKKPKNKELTKEQKVENTRISSVRVRVEHAIGSVKRMRIVKDECRLRKNNFVKTIFHTCAALHNLRLKIKPFKYDS